MEFKIVNEAGAVLDAIVEIESGALTFQSRGGAKGSPNAGNVDYANGPRLVLQRLLASPRTIVGLWVDSSKVHAMPLADRLNFAPQDLPTTAAKAFSPFSQRIEAVGQAPGAEPCKGNRNNRLRIGLSGGSVGEIAALIGTKAGPNVPRHAQRLRPKTFAASRRSIFGSPWKRCGRQKNLRQSALFGSRQKSRLELVSR